MDYWALPHICTYASDSQMLSIEKGLCITIGLSGVQVLVHVGALVPQMFFKLKIFGYKTNMVQNDCSFLLLII